MLFNMIYIHSTLHGRKDKTFFKFLVKLLYTRIQCSSVYIFHGAISSFKPSAETNTILDAVFTLLSRKAATVGSELKHELSIKVNSTFFFSIIIHLP